MKFSEHLDEIKLYHSQGLNDAEIGRIFGVPRGRIFYWRERLGLPSNNPRTKKEIPIEDLLDRYFSGQTIREMAKHIGVSRLRISAKLNQLGLDSSSSRMPDLRSYRLWELLIKGPISWSDAIEDLGLSNSKFNYLISIAPFEIEKVRINNWALAELHSHMIGDIIMLADDSRIVTYILNKLPARLSKNKLFIKKYFTPLIGKFRTELMLNELETPYGSSQRDTHRG